jgi:hypothetical protein
VRIWLTRLLRLPSAGGVVMQVCFAVAAFVWLDGYYTRSIKFDLLNFWGYAGIGFTGASLLWLLVAYGRWRSLAGISLLLNALGTAFVWLWPRI